MKKILVIMMVSVFAYAGEIVVFEDVVNVSKRGEELASVDSSIQCQGAGNNAVVKTAIEIDIDDDIRYADDRTAVENLKCDRRKNATLTLDGVEYDCGRWPNFFPPANNNNECSVVTTVEEVESVNPRFNTYQVTTKLVF